MIRRNISQGKSFFLRITGKAGFQHVRVEGNYIADPIVYLGSPTGEGKAETFRIAWDHAGWADAKLWK